MIAGAGRANILLPLLKRTGLADRWKLCTGSVAATALIAAADLLILLIGKQERTGTCPPGQLAGRARSPLA